MNQLDQPSPKFSKSPVIKIDIAVNTESTKAYYFPGSVFRCIKSRRLLPVHAAEDAEAEWADLGASRAKRGRPGSSGEPENQ